VKENAAQKGRRYLVEARLTVTAITDGLVRATCRGSGAVYELGWTRGGGWRCGCPAKGLCALLALRSVVVVRPERAA
jgi:hypothetical protein